MFLAIQGSTAALLDKKREIFLLFAHHAGRLLCVVSMQDRHVGLWRIIPVFAKFHFFSSYKYIVLFLVVVNKLLYTPNLPFWCII